MSGSELERSDPMSSADVLVGGAEHVEEGHTLSEAPAVTKV